MNTPDSALKEIVEQLPEHSNILDVGCGEGKFSIDYLQNKNLKYFGVDSQQPSALDGFKQFATVDLDRDVLPYEDEKFDFVVSQHVIEHLRDPISLFGEMGRVCKRGGTLFVLAPSDHSTWFSLPTLQHWRHIYSFYDDPTHLGRPWSPQALYRLGLFWNIEPNYAKYDWSFSALLTLLPKQIWGFITRNPDLLVSSWWKATGWIAYANYKKRHWVAGKTDYRYQSYLGYRP